jgi:hypothetical protein
MSGKKKVINEKKIIFPKISGKILLGKIKRHLIYEEYVKIKYT